MPSCSWYLEQLKAVCCLPLPFSDIIPDRIVLILSAKPLQRLTNPLLGGEGNTALRGNKKRRLSESNNEMLMTATLYLALLSCAKPFFEKMPIHHLLDIGATETQPLDAVLILSCKQAVV